MDSNIKKLTFSAMFIAIAYVLPFVAGQIPEIGQMLCPMHIPVLLCGFVCGWQWGMAVGFISPLLRSFTQPMPPLYPNAISMAFELAAYGLMTGILYRALPKKLPYIYVDLVISMIVGRIVWGTVRFVMAGLDVNNTFGLAAFWSGAITTAIPGIIVQLALVPALVYALTRAKLVLNNDPLKREIK